MPGKKTKAEKGHITATLLDRAGEVVVPRAGTCLHMKSTGGTLPSDAAWPAEGCSYYLVTLVNNTYWNISAEEYNRLKGEMA
jgi:hypothetical protein